MIRTIMIINVEISLSIISQNCSLCEDRPPAIHGTNVIPACRFHQSLQTCSSEVQFMGGPPGTFLPPTACSPHTRFCVGRTYEQPQRSQYLLTAINWHTCRIGCFRAQVSLVAHSNFAAVTIFFDRASSHRPLATKQITKCESDADINYIQQALTH
jgi:hypothetical protein